MKVPCPKPHFHDCQITFIEGVSRDMNAMIHLLVWHHEEYLTALSDYLEGIDQTVTHVG
jgi:hypothetical protein